MSNNKHPESAVRSYVDSQDRQLSAVGTAKALSDCLSLEDWKKVFPLSGRQNDSNGVTSDGQLCFTPLELDSAYNRVGTVDQRQSPGVNETTATKLKIERQESGKEMVRTQEDSASLTAPREALDRAAQQRFGPTSNEYKSFAENMKRFEDRARTAGVSPEEIADTYRQTERLLTAENAKLPLEERKVLAQNIMYHAADPKNIDQGIYNTCNVCTIQETLFTKHPSITAEMVATAALDGQWRSRDGKIIKIAPESLVPMPESRVHPPADGDRSYATQVINNILVNDVVQRRLPANFYQQLSKNPDGTPTGSDTGERLLFENGQECQRDAQDNIVRENGIPLREPTLTSADMAVLFERLTGERRIILTNSATDNDPDLKMFRSKEEFEESLQELKFSGKLPAIIMVDANHPAFGGEGGDSAGWHVVCITGYDYETGMVQISNQWGSEGDRAISIADLYESTVDHSAEKKSVNLCDSPVQAESSRHA